MAARVTAAKKAPVKKPNSQAPVAVAPRSSAPFEPLRLSSEATEPVEMVDLFEVDDVMYQVPRRPSASIGLQFLEAAEDLGPQAANLWILREMLGAEGYKALSTCKTLTDSHLTWVIETVQGLALGTVEAPKA